MLSIVLYMHRQIWCNLVLLVVCYHFQDYRDYITIIIKEITDYIIIIIIKEITDYRLQIMLSIVLYMHRQIWCNLVLLVVCYHFQDYRDYITIIIKEITDYIIIKEITDYRLQITDYRLCCQ